MRYAIVIERGTNSFGAYVPDLPGCVAVGKTRSETKRLVTKAIQLHLEDMRSTGQKIPRPASVCEYVEVAPAR